MSAWHRHSTPACVRCAVKRALQCVGGDTSNADAASNSCTGRFAVGVLRAVTAESVNVSTQQSSKFSNACKRARARTDQQPTQRRKTHSKHGRLFKQHRLPLVVLDNDAAILAVQLRKCVLRW